MLLSHFVNAVYKVIEAIPFHMIFFIERLVRFLHNSHVSNSRFGFIHFFLTFLFISAFLIFLFNCNNPLFILFNLLFLFTDKAFNRITPDQTLQMIGMKMRNETDGSVFSLINPELA